MLYTAGPLITGLLKTGPKSENYMAGYLYVVC